MTSKQQLAEIQDFVPGGFILIANAKAKVDSNFANVIMSEVVRYSKEILFKAEAMRAHEKNIAPSISWINPELLISASEKVLDLVGQKDSTPNMEGN
jgi:hypothetical protein|tara:strand:- start:2550 stop:2840 length:291 start_codon:yes stop_codon:yes gene_type:complete